MNPRWDESEFVFGDLHTVAQFIHHDNPFAARLFLEAAYDTFSFLRKIPALAASARTWDFPEIRSWRVKGFGFI